MMPSQVLTILPSLLINIVVGNTLTKYLTVSSPSRSATEGYSTPYLIKNF